MLLRLSRTHLARGAISRERESAHVELFTRRSRRRELIAGECRMENEETGLAANWSSRINNRGRTSKLEGYQSMENRGAGLMEDESLQSSLNSGVGELGAQVLCIYRLIYVIMFVFILLVLYGNFPKELARLSL